jgi:hypothetical protein
VIYGWAEMLAPAYGALAQQFNIVTSIPAMLTPELWHCQWAIWLDICYFEFLRPCDKWSRSQIRQETSVSCIKCDYSGVFHWFNVFHYLEWPSGQPIDREPWRCAVRDASGWRCGGSVFPYLYFLTTSYFVHQRGLRFALWILAIAVSASVSAIISGFIIQSMGWPMTFKICNRNR